MKAMNSIQHPPLYRIVQSTVPHNDAVGLYALHFVGSVVGKFEPSPSNSCAE